MIKLGIYGGTFSPIHMGHVVAAQAFLRNACLDKLLIMPTAISPHKNVTAGVNAEDRLKMVRLAFEGTEEYKSGRLEVSDYEIMRGGKSYTVYTLEHFSRPDVILHMLVGTDMFLTLDKWYRSEDIFRLAEIVLMRREMDSDRSEEIERKCEEYIEKYSAKIKIIPEPPIVVSSTELRESIKNGCSTEGLLPDGVAEFISKNNLYMQSEGELCLPENKKST